MTTKPYLSRVSRDAQRKEDDEPQPPTSRARRGGTPESGRSVRPKGANLLGEVTGARVHVIGRKGWGRHGHRLRQYLPSGNRQRHPSR